MRDYTVTYNGKPQYMLNARMAERQCINDAQLIELKRLHQEKLRTFEYMEDYNDCLREAIRQQQASEEDIAFYKNQLRTAAHQVEQIEFEMQDNWNYSRDAGMHEWYNVPGCTCPKADNMDRRYPGSLFRIISPACPVHSSQPCPPIDEEEQ